MKNENYVITCVYLGVKFVNKSEMESNTNMLIRVVRWITELAAIYRLLIKCKFVEILYEFRGRSSLKFDKRAENLLS